MLGEKWERRVKDYVKAGQTEPAEDVRMGVVQNFLAPDELKQAYSKACKALSALRAYHLGFATHYLKAALKGTGGSDFRSLLDEGLVSTREAARVAGCSGL